MDLLPYPVFVPVDINNGPTEVSVLLILLEEFAILALYVFFGVMTIGAFYGLWERHKHRKEKEEEKNAD